MGTGHLDKLSLLPVPERARIVFVDDDELVLRSIRRLLRGKEKDWNLVFVSDGHAALREIESAPVDVIVSDVQMATMGGGKLLAAIQERHPDIARVVLSGETDPRIIHRTAPFAHQYMGKPFDAAILMSALSRACALRSLLTNDAIRSVVGHAGDLPAAPVTYLELTRALRSRETNARLLADIVERDVEVSARVLRLASSSLFGARRGVTSISGAMGHLGLDTVRMLVLACELVQAYAPASSFDSFSIDRFQEHGIKTGRLARAMVGESAVAEDCFVAGLLHRVGELVLASAAPRRFAEVLDSSARTGKNRFIAEREVLGVTHAQVGAYLLGLWGLRQRVVEAVLYYSHPERVDPVFGIPAAVHVASILADDPQAPLGGEPNDEMREVPASYLDRLEVLDRLPEWRTMASRTTVPSRAPEA